MTDLVELVKGEWHWNLKPGKRYYLGIHHGTVTGLNGKDVYGTYIGIIKDREVFVDKTEKGYNSYSCLPDTLAMFMSECDDGPEIPFVPVTYDGVVLKNYPEELVLEKLSELEPKKEQLEFQF